MTGWVSGKGPLPVAPHGHDIELNLRGTTRMTFVGARGLALAIWVGVAAGMLTAWEIDRRLHPEASRGAAEDWRAE
jgi:hypothetical protein